MKQAGFRNNYVLRDLAPPYRSASLRSVVDVDSRRRLTSAADTDILLIPVASPRTRNDLPDTVRSASLLPSFKRQLKTVLFSRRFTFLNHHSESCSFPNLGHYKNVVCIYITFMQEDARLLDGVCVCSRRNSQETCMIWYQETNDKLISWYQNFNYWYGRVKKTFSENRNSILDIWMTRNQFLISRIQFVICDITRISPRQWLVHHLKSRLNTKTASHTIVSTFKVEVRTKSVFTEAWQHCSFDPPAP